MSLTLPSSHADTSAQIEDYVLGLLSDEQRRRLELHVAACASCRAQLQRERQVGPLVGAAVRHAARIEPRRLRALQPPAPRRRPGWGTATRQLALVGALLLLLLGAAGLTQRSGGWLDNQPAYTAPTLAAQPTVTGTATPTVTASPTAISRHVITPEPAGDPGARPAAVPLPTPMTALALTLP